MTIQVEVSMGEALDRLSITLIKTMKLQGKERLISIYNLVNAIQPIQRDLCPELINLFERLISINNTLWDLEIEARHSNSPDNKLVSLMRHIQTANAERARIKKDINNWIDDLDEIKNYQPVPNS